MSEGWYPDPSGAPGSYRYWDGNAWGPQTTSNPGDPLPGGPRPEPPTVHTPQQGPPAQPPQQAPQQPAQQAGWANPQGQPGYGYGAPLTSPPQGGSGGGGRTAIVVVAGVVVLLLVIIGGFFGVRALTGGDDDPDPKADPTTSGTSGSTDDPTEGLDPENPTATQCNGGNPFGRLPSQDDGRMQSGGVSVPFQTGYDLDLERDAMPWADQVAIRGERVTKKWLAVVATGGLRKSNGYQGLEQSALTVMTCLQQGDSFYSDIADSEQTQSEAIEVDGQDAWAVTQEITIEKPAQGITGGTVQVVVVDTGSNRSFGLYLSDVPLEDQALIDQRDQALDDLEVED